MIKVYRASDLEPIIDTCSPQLISPYYLNMLEEKFIIPEEFDSPSRPSNHQEGTG